MNFFCRKKRTTRQVLFRKVHPQGKARLNGRCLMTLHNRLKKRLEAPSKDLQSQPRVQMTSTTRYAFQNEDIFNLSYFFLRVKMAAKTNIFVLALAILTPSYGGSTKLCSCLCFLLYEPTQPLGRHRCSAFSATTI